MTGTCICGGPLPCNCTEIPERVRDEPPPKLTNRITGEPQGAGPLDCAAAKELLEFHGYEAPEDGYEALYKWLKVRDSGDYRRKLAEPGATPESLAGTWPGEVDDGFENDIDELRHPERNK